MDLKFEAKNETVEKVLFSNEKFQIPKYQRPYAWKEDQISEFWNDLVVNEGPYFIGSLIFNYQSYKSTGLIYIIDGQQRLLTITIFAAVLRDISAKIDPKFAGLIQRKEIVFEDRNGEESCRITPGDTAKQYFHRYIQQSGESVSESTPQTKEERRIKRNYQYFYDKVDKWLSGVSNNKNKIKRIKTLRNKIYALIVIRIHIENEEAAYEIFETTNARGVDLSVADLLKNLIFKNMPNKKNSDATKDAWQEITDNIESTNTELKRFLRYFWISKYEFVTEKKLFIKIKQHTKDWKKILSDLRGASREFNQLLEGTDKDFNSLKKGNQIFKSVFALRLMGVSQCHVLLLSILRNYDKIKTDPVKIFQLIEKFTFKYSVVCKQPGNIVERIYSKYAIEIEKAVKETPDKKMSGKIQSIFARLEKKLKAEEPSKELFKESFIKLYYRNSKKYRMLITYILNSVDSYYSKTREQAIDFYHVNIEHILPQKPCKGWGLKPKEIKKYVNTIGNLTLLAKQINSQAQNLTIKNKIKFYRESELPITKKLVKTLEGSGLTWGEKEIQQRQEEIAKIAYDEIWKI